MKGRIIEILSNATDNGQNTFSERCKVDSEFSFYNYKASPDGIYKFHLINDESTLDYTKVDKLRVQLAGSWIPFATKIDDKKNDPS